MFQVASISKLVFMSGPYFGKSIVLQPGRLLVIGRDRSADLTLDDETLSRRHCVIMSHNHTGGFKVKDLDSVNGTFVNGTRITASTELLEFDRLFVGSTELEFRCSDEGSRTLPVTVSDFQPPV